MIIAFDYMTSFYRDAPRFAEACHALTALGHTCVVCHGVHAQSKSADEARVTVGDVAVLVFELGAWTMEQRIAALKKHGYAPDYWLLDAEPLDRS